jgi:hypothetical protein
MGTPVGVFYFLFSFEIGGGHAMHHYLSRVTIYLTLLYFIVLYLTLLYLIFLFPHSPSYNLYYHVYTTL